MILVFEGILMCHRSQIGGVPPLALDALNCTNTDNFFALANLKSLFNVTTYIGAASLPSIPDLANSISPATEAPVLQQLAAFVDTSFESLVSTTQINSMERRQGLFLLLTECLQILSQS